MDNRKFVRIVALILAILMLLGVVTGAIMSTFAVSPDALLVLPPTGESSKALPIALCCAGGFVLVACIVMPLLKKKKDDE